MHRFPIERFLWLVALFLVLIPLPAAHAVPAAWSAIYGNCSTTPTVVTLLTVGTGQTYNVPADWNSSQVCANPFANKVEVYAVGGQGDNGSGLRLGGGGGGYSAQTNIVLTPSGTAPYQLGAAGDSWFNGATLAASSVGAHPGGIGSGGSTTGATGSVVFRGGNSTCGSGKCGGGGGAGPSGNGGDTSTTTGGVASGGLSGSGGDGSAAGVGNPGNTNGGGGGAGATGGGGNGGSEIVITYYHLQ